MLISVYWIALIVYSFVFSLFTYISSPSLVLPFCGENIDSIANVKCIKLHTSYGLHNNVITNRAATLCSLVEVDRRFGDPYCLRYQGDHYGGSKHL
jgi:hypothetical protein